jgi:hypothetical protein
MDYIYEISPVAADRLAQEIAAEQDITVVLNSVTTYGSQVTCSFRAALSVAEEAALDLVVDAHGGTPLPQPEPSVVVHEMPDPAPFARPTFRTKRAAVSAPVSVEPNDTETIDYVLAAERYVSGGTLIVENAVFGDYITAEVCDPNGYIPEAYRPSLCENWPVVALYIEKEFVEVGGTITVHRINTYPLNAKITAGLVLRLTYHAVNSGTARRACVNYNLSKKL